MLGWSVIFFVVAVIAGIFGFGGISEAATDVALVLFFIAVAAFIITLIAGLFVGKKVTDKL